MEYDLYNFVLCQNLKKNVSFKRLEICAHETYTIYYKSITFNILNTYFFSSFFS